MKMDINRVVQIRGGSVTFFGIGAIDKFPEILDIYKGRGLSRAAIITGRNSYRISGAWEKIEDVLSQKKIEYIHYDGIRANPSVDQIDEAVKRVSDFKPQFVIGIGGGSVLDASKIVAALLRNTGKEARDIYVKDFVPQEALPVVAINLTHGTGSEIDRYAVATVPELKDKSGAAAECLYPEYAIDDPTLMLTLPEKQLIYTSLDAVNHLVEAATTTLSSPYTVMLAREGIDIIAKWLSVALKDPSDLEARYWLLYASVLGGIAIDCAVVHITHPLEHTLSAVKPELEHGLGLSILLPSVLKAIYDVQKDVLDLILDPVTRGKRGALEVARQVEQWIFSFGVKEKLQDVGFSNDDIQDLVKYTMEAQAGGGSLSLAPLEVTEELVRQIYEESLNPLSV
ncbi:MAG: iron-containing alcohol dehydrogenase [Nitrospirae bacterium]|nr:iron-containing alcohol dehydrogenase [Nitrospirota bacterium]